MLGDYSHVRRDEMWLTKHLRVHALENKIIRSLAIQFYQECIMDIATSIFLNNNDPIIRSKPIGSVAQMSEFFSFVTQIGFPGHLLIHCKRLLRTSRRTAACRVCRSSTASSVAQFWPLPSSWRDSPDAVGKARLLISHVKWDDQHNDWGQVF